jgi:hypothetical protein
VSKDAITLWILARIFRSYASTSGGTSVSIADISDHSLLPTLIAELGHSPWANVPKLPRPSSWRDVGHKLRSHYYQRALDNLGPSFKFDVRLSNELMARGHADSKALTSLLQKRVALCLKRQLRGPICFWFVIETLPGARHPHLHGAVSISEEERVQLRRSLLTASNCKGKFRKRAVRTTLVQTGFGVSGYATKSLARTAFEFPGRNVTATHSVKRIAQQIFEKDREFILKLRHEFAERPKPSRKPLPGSSGASGSPRNGTGSL